jgi:hypothetical protein
MKKLLTTVALLSIFCLPAMADTMSGDKCYDFKDFTELFKKADQNLVAQEELWVAEEGYPLGSRWSGMPKSAIQFTIRHYLGPKGWTVIVSRMVMEHSSLRDRICIIGPDGQIPWEN